jgi:hypothetical protein
MAENTSEVPAEGLEIDLLGTRVHMAIEDGELTAYLTHLLRDVRASSRGRPAERFEILGGGDSDWVLRHHGKGVLRTNSRKRLIERYFAILNDLCLDNYAGLTVHAGVIASGSCAIAIPGPSGAGKSTLVAACVAAGFSYVSDEALCIDSRGLKVTPYPRPILLSDDSMRLVGIKAMSVSSDDDKTPLAPADLGGSTSSGTLHLAHVLLPVKGTALGLEPVATNEVVPVLLANSFNRYLDPTAAFQLITTAAASCRAWRLSYNDALDAAALLRRLLPFSQPSH